MAHVFFRILGLIQAENADIRLTIIDVCMYVGGVRKIGLSMVVGIRNIKHIRIWQFCFIMGRLLITYKVHESLYKYRKRFFL